MLDLQRTHRCLTLVSQMHTLLSRGLKLPKSHEGTLERCVPLVSQMHTLLSRGLKLPKSQFVMRIPIQ
jgi:hypothetical protein